jgi:heme exporter protein C
MEHVTRRLSENRGVVSATAAVALLAASIGLIFFYAPDDTDQGFSQRIFYFHVPLALTSYVCFAWGAWKALRVLWKGDDDADLESYVAIHQGVIFGALTLVTGSLWARANMCAVYALFGVVLIPISFLAIRLSRKFIHPVVFTSHGPQMAGSQFLTFCVALAGMVMLFVVLYQVELAGKRIDAHLRDLRELLA